MNKKSKSKKSKKFLFIQIKDDHIQDIIDLFCKESGISSQEIGFSLGMIAGQGKEFSDNAVSLSMTYFYAGIMYAMKHPEKVIFEYKTHAMLEEFKKNILKKDKMPIDYMG